MSHPDDYKFRNEVHKTINKDFRYFDWDQRIGMVVLQIYNDADSQMGVIITYDSDKYENSYVRSSISGDPNLMIELFNNGQALAEVLHYLEPYPFEPKPANFDLCATPA